MSRDESTPDEPGDDRVLPTAADKAAPSQPPLDSAPAVVKRSFPMALSICGGILLAALAGWFFYSLTWFLLLIYLSFVAATILDAPVHWLIRLGLRRGFAAALVMVGGLILVGTLFYFVGAGLYSQVNAVSADLERAPKRIDDAVNSFKERFKRNPRPLSPEKSSATSAAWRGDAPPSPLAFEDHLLTAHEPPATESGTTQPTSAPATAPGDFHVANSLANVADMTTIETNALRSVRAISWIVISFFIVLYMLVDGPDHLRGGRSLLPKHARLGATRLFHEIARAHRGWALASLANVCSATILASTGLYLLGVPGAFLLGFFAGLGELIPNFGPIVGAMPALLLTLIATPHMFLYVLGMFVVVETIQSYTISPQMVKFSIELPVLVTIISVLVFGTLFGFLGILVAIPFVADMVVVWNYIARLREQDTLDYDTINAPAESRRPVKLENPFPPSLRKLFHRRRDSQSAPPGERGPGKKSKDDPA